MALKHVWKIELVPWDHSSSAHVERLYHQRVACGWRADEVQSWVESAKKGGKMFYWATLSKAVPDWNNLMQKHTQAYPKQATPLRDTAKEIRLVAREPTNAEFIPIGHIALEIHSAEEDAKLGLPSPGTVWAHQLYISDALQNGGYGIATMAQAEAIATKEPMNATTMALDTLAKTVEDDLEGIERIEIGNGNSVPVTSKEDWYARQGYYTYERGSGYVYEMPDGRKVPLTVSFMRKDIGSKQN